MLERQIAIDAVLKAAQVTQKAFKQLVGTITKTDASPVTVADYSSQAIINSILSQHFQDPIIGEEDSASLRENPTLLNQVVDMVSSIQPMDADQVCKAIDLGNSNGGVRFWTLDPIDGTKGFLRGDQYAICLALVDQGIVQLAVLGCPNMDSLFIAQHGKGAVFRSFTDPKEIPIRISNTNKLNEIVFCESFESSHSNHSLTDTIAKELQIEKPPVRMDSQAKYGVVSKGLADAYIRIPPNGYIEKIWDHAAGSLLVQESGGKVTDLRGNPLDFTLGRHLSNNLGILATNGHVHDELLRIINKSM